MKADGGVRRDVADVIPAVIGYPMPTELSPLVPVQVVLPKPRKAEPLLLFYACVWGLSIENDKHGRDFKVGSGIPFRPAGQTPPPPDSPAGRRCPRALRKAVVYFAGTMGSST